MSSSVVSSPGPRSTPLPLDFLERTVGQKSVLVAKEDLIPYSFDGTAAMTANARLCCVRQNAQQVSAILQVANRLKIPVVTRGSGTGLSGGSLPSPIASCFALVRMDKILELDRANLTMLVEAGRHHPGESPTPPMRPGFFIRLIRVR